MSREKDYALYKGDELIAIGTKKEIAEATGLKISSVAFYGTPSYRKNLKDDEDGLILIRIEDDEDEV